MKFEEVNMAISKIFATTDMVLQETATKVDEVMTMAQNGEVSESEAKDLLADIERENFINAEITDLKGKAALAQIFDWAKTGVSFL